MKKLWILAALGVLLTGCGSQTVFETVEDALLEPASVTNRQVCLDLPQEAALQVMENGEGERLYLCDRYTVTVQTLPGGDLDKTIRTVTGFDREDLTVIQTRQADAKRSECVWSAAGEGTLQVCRCAVLDDGNFHYVVSAMADQTAAGGLRETWQELFASVTLSDIDA